MKNPKRILVSEDTSLWQGIFAKLLVPEGYEVHQAVDLKATLDALNQFFFNVVIVDLALDPKDESRMDGLETMKAIVRLQEGTQAIVLTGKGTVQLAVSALRDFHVHHFLEKEKFDAQAFLETLLEATTQSYRRALSPGHFPPTETVLGPVEWHRLASTLGLSRNDLEVMFGALVREAMPIKFVGSHLQPKASLETHTLSVAFWSKWHGRAVTVMVGRTGNISVPAGTTLIEKRELGKMCGFIVSSSENYAQYCGT